MFSRKFIVLAVAATVALVGGPALADHGEKVFKKCKACHTIKAGKHRVGPSLAGVFGRKAGTAEGFKKYKGLKGADWTWDDANLNEYLTDPKKFAKKKAGKKSSMVLKLKKKKDREHIIEYLKTIK
ncbi:MAG: c-type cytochrome [Rhodospirillales bacterium]|jgi:cytochrome c|nr:c-type cytochrome [Rhodospirillales bacterium]MDP6774081.1 c-type cytochrome [Rhodospirillales bacterium]